MSNDLIKIFFIFTSSIFIMSFSSNNPQRETPKLSSQETVINNFIKNFNSNATEDAINNYHQNNFAFFITYAYPSSKRVIPGLKIDSDCILNNYGELSSSPLDPIEKFMTNDAPSQAEENAMKIGWSYKVTYNKILADLLVGNKCF